MICFRISEEQYTALRDSCAANGARSVSELARYAMQEYLSSNITAGQGTVHIRIENLASRVAVLDHAVQHLAQIVTPGRPAAPRQEAGGAEREAT